MATIASELTTRLESAIKRRGLSVHRNIMDRCDIIRCLCGWRINLYIDYRTDERMLQVIKEIDGHACEKQVQKPEFTSHAMRPGKLYPVEFTPPVGWKCPTCNHGNAPWAASCSNCAFIEWSKQSVALHLSKEQCAEIERMLTAPHNDPKQTAMPQTIGEWATANGRESIIRDIKRTRDHFASDVGEP